MFKKQDPSAVEATIKKSQDFEVTLVDIRKKNERRAWIVASVAILIAISTLGGLFYILPLKEKEPYLIMADAYSGQATLARLKGDWRNTPLTAAEAINKSNVTHFIQARESFDSELLGLRDWNTVFSMSTPGVSNEYRALLSSTNPNNLFIQYGKLQSLRVKILSVALNYPNGATPGQNTTPDGATVRFQRFVYSKQNGSVTYLDNKIATIKFTYEPNLRMDEKFMIENPLGFQVTSYRVDIDASTAPAPNDLVPSIDTQKPVLPNMGVVPSNGEVPVNGSVPPNSVGSGAIPVTSPQGAK